MKSETPSPGVLRAPASPHGSAERSSLRRLIQYQAALHRCPCAGVARVSLLCHPQLGQIDRNAVEGGDKLARRAQRKVHVGPGRAVLEQSRVPFQHAHRVEADTGILDIGAGFLGPEIDLISWC